MAQSKVAVVILNWNGKKFLEKFLPKVEATMPQYASLWVADNQSQDDSIEFLRKSFPAVNIIINDKNYGFAEGYNQALRQIESEYYVLLNSDIEVKDRWIEPIIDMMDSDPTIGACQPKLLSYSEPHKFEYAGAAGGFIDKYGYPFCRGRIFQETEEDTGQYNNNIEVFWATGACLFTRADLYHQTGGLDADFFAHMEEIDYCWRLKNAGYKIMYCADSVVYHVGGGTLPKANPRKTFLNFRNNFYLLFKNLPTHRLIPVFVVRLILDAFAGLKFISEGDYKDTWAVVRAHWAFFASIPSLIKKRKTTNPTNVPHIFNQCIVWKHYILKIKRFVDL